MCGIFGIAGSHDRDKAIRALRLLDHRGPDNAGYFSDEEIFLGHTRLSILDLSPKGNQPMSDSEAKVWITFNGEIYNFKYLKRELEDEFTFNSTCDTEVMLYAYKRYGLTLPEKINGMFAFAVWDAPRKTLFLARDRFGKKPLYYTFRKGTFMFSSEIKSLLMMLDEKPRIDKTAFLQYLSFLASLPPGTIYEGIHKLPAGHFIRFEGGGVRVTQYYDILDRVTPCGIGTEAQARDAVEHLLLDCVRSRLIADVPVGSLLSGGIDSSLISALYSAENCGPIHTFSIGYSDHKQYDELAYAQLAADSIHSIHHAMAVTKETFVNAFDAIIYHLDEPVNDSACIPTYLLADMVKKSGVKVILSGEGSDETFLGYDFYFEMLNYYRLQDTTGSDQKKLLLSYFMDNFNLSKRWEYFRRSFTDSTLYRTVGENYTDAQKRLLLRREEFPSIDDDLSHEYIKGHWNAFRQSGLRGVDHWMSYIDFKVWIPEVLMAKIDRMTMAHSIESRAPFLDHRLVELAFSLDGTLRRGEQTKSLLKPIAEKYIPGEIVHRRKKGFSSPHLEWFYEYYGDDILKEWRAMNNELGWFNNDFLTFLYDEGANGRFKQHVWSLIVFQRWFKKYCGEN